MSTFVLCDRLGNSTPLAVGEGDTVEQVLLRGRVPPPSVLVVSDGVPVADSARVERGHRYDAYLIEGYDIGAIMDVYRAFDKESKSAFDKRRIHVQPGGYLQPQVAPLSREAVRQNVEQTILETVLEYSLIEDGDRLLVGVSGGVDSSALVLGLDAVRDRLPSFSLVGVTFEDFDAVGAPTLEQAREVSRRAGMEHHLAPASLAQETFHLRLPLAEALEYLMTTEHSPYVMYLDHHTTRRSLEVYAAQIGCNRIALGLHTTDLLAGLLNSWATGYEVGDLPRRQLQDVVYIYPLAFVSKRELHLYFEARLGRLASHSFPNEWERDPLDRNFYYYVADHLQALWPGIELAMFTGHHWRARRQGHQRYRQCANCGATLLEQVFTAGGEAECDACQIFERAGLREGGSDESGN